jgi:PAS domain S-box-containing protein
MATPRNLRVPSRASRPALPPRPISPSAGPRATDNGRAAQIVQSATDAILSVDASARIETWNQAAEELLGYSAAEAIGRPVSIIIPPGRVREHQRLFARVMAGECIRQYETVWQHKDGGSLSVSLTLFGLRDAGGAVVAAASIVRDISERIASDRNAASEQARRELDEMSWIGRLRDAMDEGRLELAAQPIVSLLDGRTGRHELLLRLRDRSGHLVAPGEFLPAAERFNLIGELDRWVLARGARLAAEGHAVNVNISARSLGDPELGPWTERALREAGAEPGLITFEITETAITGHPELACSFARDIAALGCRFALDDFGTGYGAFTYLKQLPIHYLKIDREFVHDVAHNAASRHVVQALVSLARGFGQQTIAEGVESQETLELLRELGVDHAQGFHLGAPGPLGDMAARTSG